MKTKIPMSQIVKDQEWQKVRESLLNKWSSDPAGCCNKIKKYLGSINKTEDKKLVIIMNYLTGSGFRTGKIKHPCISSIRTQVSMEMKKRKAKQEWSM